MSDWIERQRAMRERRYERSRDGNPKGGAVNGSGGGTPAHGGGADAEPVHGDADPLAPPGTERSP